ncbi:CHAT domain-containing protein [Gandjariella thermophila]|uniref:CHAT domain-containing protein n=1 Tax=Gandjariella thermophila TaxID=1931992 RepID=A0A4D4J9N1_9PSEU|nr:CHAT domain-containing protein [Gandjariella thermophila]GDY31982.1 hypothetical protein GTS_36150 [Gandjariella thermophila]
MLEFDELRVRVRRIGARRYLVLANGAAHAATIRRVADEPAELRREFDELIDIELGNAPTGATNVSTRLRQLGRSVFDLVFDEELAACLRRARAQTQRHTHGLRLRFDLPAELHDLPVEALRSPSDRAEQTLALNANLSVVRSLPGDSPGHRLPTAGDEPEVIRLLVATASPVEAGLPPIDVEHELAALRAALPALVMQMTVREHATRRDIETWLAEHTDRPAAVLLIAHGSYDRARDEGVVLLEGEDGAADRVPGHLLSGILVRAQRLRLVVLNLCDGASNTRLEPFAGVAQALIGRGIPAVAGMNGLVTDRAAITFGPLLLEGVCSNKTVDEAMTAARQHIANLPGHTTIEWATPTLFLHEACGHGWLFKAREVVGGDDEVTDPLRAGEAALARFDAPGNVDLASVLAAARFLRTAHDWDGVLRTARTRKQTHDQSLLITEAQIELAWPAIERLCEVLAAEADPEQAAKLLDGVRPLLPGALFRRLHQEIGQVRALADLVAKAEAAEAGADWSTAVRCYEEVLAQRPDGIRNVPARLAAARQEAGLAARYASAEEHRLAGRWPAALAGYTDVLALRGDGYRAAAEWAGYARGRLAEADGRWADATAAYQDCGGFEDAPARLAAVRGRAAADAGDWAEAHRHLVAAGRLGAPVDEWSRYAAARVAEAAEQWAAAAEEFTRLGAFLDSEGRARFAAGHVAAESGDQVAAVRAWEALAGDGWAVAAPLAAARGALYQRAVAAEQAQEWPRAAEWFGVLPPDHGDAAARAEYARARIAETAGDWPAAAEGYQRAGEHADATARLGYARARSAELAGEWEAAAEQYATLPRRLLDAAARAQYAAGRAADTREDWAGVLDSFGGLPNDFAGGEVGRRRRFARAKLAEQGTEWTSVLALLGEAPDEERDGLVGLLRRKARGRLAEGEDWASAAAIYAPAAHADEDLGRSHRYATGRVSERDEEWSEALAAYAGLPEDYRDVAVRAGYAHARLAEQAAAADTDEVAGWRRVIEAYAAMPEEFGDVAVRSAYAQARLAGAEGRWDTAHGMADALGDYRDAPVLAGYARGRLAEQREDWAEASTAYQGCAGYADAAARRAYTSGRERENAGQWSAAVAAYLEAEPAIPAAEQRRDRLVRLLDALPWADGVASATLVADPVALREETFPYRALLPAGVTPASATEIVKDAAYALMERGGMTWQERVAWDRLRTPAKRLLLDALLYRFRDAASLGRELNALEPGAPAALLARLCERLPEDAGLLTLLAGNRADAVAAWRQRLTETPGDMALAHSLAVASFWQAKELEDTGAWEQAPQVWRTALACWAAVLTDDDCWTGWRQARAACYGHAVTPADTARLRTELGRYLIDVVAGHAEGHANAGRSRQSERYRELISFLETELDAAQSLKEAGGLPLPGRAEETLACGPAYLSMVGLAREFGQFVAAADALRVDDTQSSRAVVRRLRWSFSELSTAFSLIEHHRFEAALPALPAFHRQRLAELPADCADPTEAGHPDLDECPRCREFLARNPAYTYLPRRWARLLQDAVELAVRAHLAIARGLLTSGGQVDRAMSELDGAIAVSANAAMTVRTRQAVLRMVLGRVDALTDQSRQQINRLDEAVTLVEKTLPVVGAAGRSTLTLKWAELLIDRGVWYGSGCRDFGLRPDIRRAVADLRRALDLNPESARARDNLARALIYGQDELRLDHTVAGSLAILREALAIVNAGLERAAANNRLRDTLGDVLEELESVLLDKLSVTDLGRLIESYGESDGSPPDPRERAKTLAEQAERRRADGDFTGALHDLVRATRADPSSAPIRAALLAALDAELARLRDEGSTG